MSRKQHVSEQATNKTSGQSLESELAQISSGSMMPSLKPKRGEGRLTPLLSNILGFLLIIGVFVLVIPLSVPQMMGYEVHLVASESMAPTIPNDSVIYVNPVEAAAIVEGDIIAYYEDEEVVATQRVEYNDVETRQLFTKGENGAADDDPYPIPYENYIGTVTECIPWLGRIMSVFVTTVGKGYFLVALASGLLLNILAGRLRIVHRQRFLDRLRVEFATMWRSQQAAAKRAIKTASDAQKLGASNAIVNDGTDLASQLESYGDTSAVEVIKELQRSTRAPSRRVLLRTAAMTILSILFLGSTAVVFYVQYNYQQSGEIYRKASNRYTIVKPVGEYRDQEAEVAPIEVDFDELCGANKDVVGWIYCEDTYINYPVLHGDTNDTYLRRDYMHRDNIDGSIFCDAGNRRGFADANTIIYGHHMNYGTYGKMFACLDDWADQEYYESHPVMWLLTPTQDYKIVLFSGHHTNAYSNMYDIYASHDKKLEKYLAEAVKESDFKPLEGVTVDEKEGKFVMLSTCAYIFQNARYVIHGELVPVESAGGKPFQSSDLQAPEVTDPEAEATEEAAPEAEVAPTE